jgi:K+-dependent Na+/Ca+ exchanger-like protein
VLVHQYLMSSLDVLRERTGISEDVSGATFMAAATSSPELFTSLVGIFLGTDDTAADTGIGAVVGSAVFNILVIIGLTGALSPKVVGLDFRPFVRDLAFFLLSVVLLYVTMRDKVIDWVDSVVLLSGYVLYLVYMAFNARINSKCCPTACGAALGGDNDPLLLLGEEMRVYRALDGGPATPVVASAARARRPARRRLRALALAVLFSVRVVNPRRRRAHASAPPAVSDVEMGDLGASAIEEDLTVRDVHRPHVQRVIFSVPMSPPRGGAGQQDHQQHHLLAPHRLQRPSAYAVFAQNASSAAASRRRATAHAPSGYLDLGDSTLDLSPMGRARLPSVHEEVGDDLASLLKREDVMFPAPDPAESHGARSVGKKLLHWVSLPFKIIFLCTVPDCSVPRYRLGYWYILSICLCILYVAGFSLSLVEWASRAGCIIGIHPDIMGLTVLAAGGSTPDALASITVARSGQGGMAVSLSIGCNLFNFFVGLGLPWLLKTTITGKTIPVAHDSIGVLCAILAFSALYVLIVFVMSRWRLFPATSYSLFMLYACFTIYVLLRAIGVIGQTV